MGNINTLLALDGESEFRRQLNLINANLKALDSELKAVSNEFVIEGSEMQHATKLIDNYAKQIEFLNAKENVLQKAVSHSGQELENNRKKVDEARAAYDKSVRAIEYQKVAIESATAFYGENSREVQLLEIKLGELEKAERLAAAEVAKAEKETDKTALAYQRYRQQLGETRSQIHQVEEAERNCRNATESLTSSNNTAIVSAETLKRSFDLLKTTVDATVKVVTAMGKALVDAANVEFKAFSASVNAVNEEIKLASEGFEKYVEGIAKITKAVGTFAYNSGAGFEASMSKVQAYSQESAENMELLSDAAKNAGAVTSKTASEAADALGYLALNGYKTEQMLSTLMPVVKASEAGQMDLATTANLTARSLTAYGEGAEQAERMLNILVAAQNNSSTSLYDLLTAYADMAGTFKTLNIPMEESATVLGVFANQGKSGAEAATALSSVMLRLLGTNKKANAAMESVGVTAWNEDGSFRGLTTTLRDLGDAMQNMTAEQETLIESQIGGVMRVQELKKLIDGVNDIDAYNRVADPINAALENNVLFSTSEIMLDNLKGSITLFKSAMESLGIAIYETFGDELEKNIDLFSKWAETLKRGVENEHIEGAITRVMAMANKSVQREIALVARRLPKYLNIINQVLITGAEDTIDQADKAIQLVLPKLLKGFTNLITSLVDLLPSATKVLSEGAGSLFGGLVTALQETSQHLLEVLPETIDTITGFFSENTSELYLAGLDILIELSQGITDNLPQLIETAVQIIKEICNGINDRIDTIVETGGEILNQLINGIIDVTPTLVDTAFTILQSLADYIDDNIDEILRGAESIVSEIGTGIVENLPNLLESALAIITKIVDYLCEDDNLSDLVRGALEILEVLAKFLLDNADTIVNQIPKLVDAIADGLSDNADLLIDVGVDFGDAIVKGMITAFKGAWIGNSLQEKNFINDMAGEFFPDFATVPEDIVAEATSDASRASRPLGVSITPDGIREYPSSPVDVNLYGNISINDTERDLPDLLEMTKAAIRDAELGRGR